MRYFLFFIGLIFLCSPLFAEDEFASSSLEGEIKAVERTPTPNRWALLIFADPEASPYAGLRFVVEDFQKTLKKTGFADDHVFVMQPDAEAALKPTLVNIRRQLDEIRRSETSFRKEVDGDAELFLFVQMRGLADPEQKRQFLCPSDRMEISADADLERLAETLLPAEEFLDVLLKSGIERRLFVLNITSPTMTRGATNTKPTLSGIRSSAFKTRSAEVGETTESPKAFVPGSALAQIVVNNQFDFEPDHADGFTNILRRGLEGFADRDLDGNRNGVVSLRELVDYIEYYCNNVRRNSTFALYKGFDYPMTTAAPTETAAADTDLETLYAKVGTELATLSDPVAKDDALEAFERGIETAKQNDNDAELRRITRLRDDYLKRMPKKPSIIHTNSKHERNTL